MTGKKPPSLTDAFNRDMSASKLNNSVLCAGNGVTTSYYDFTQRIVMNSRGAITPFSQIDRDILIVMRDKLVELGGDPPELPLETPVAPPRKFNL